MFVKQVVEIDYTNWRNERRIRKIIPVSGSLHFGINTWHTEAQWLFEAFDIDSGKLKTFALLGIHSCKQIEEG